jgi:hypothetical protein
MGRSVNAKIVQPKHLVDSPQTHFAKLRLKKYQYDHNGHYVTSMDDLDISNLVKAAAPEKSAI